jgi:hypothetical protein
MLIYFFLFLIYKITMANFRGSNNSYPEHEFSKYIDNDFSFSNQVQYSSKADLVDMIKYSRVEGGIMLEPRLQEYIKKRKHYTDTRTKPCISPEKEYSITERDIKALRSFFKGSNQNYSMFDVDNNTSKKSIPSFPSSKFKDDPRVLKPKRSSRDDKLVNLGMFVPDEDQTYYEGSAQKVDNVMDGRDLADFNMPVGGFEPNDSRFNPRIDSNIDFRTSAVPDDISSDFSKSKSRYYVEGNDDLYFDMDASKESQERSNKKKIRKREKRTNRNIIDYNMEESLEDCQGIDTSKVDLDTYMMSGVPDNTTKSYGHRNPAEHYYDYIDANFQNADNSVQCWTRGGESTRMDNKKTNKRPYKRDVM